MFGFGSASNMELNQVHKTFCSYTCGVAPASISCGMEPAAAIVAFLFNSLLELVCVQK